MYPDPSAELAGSSGDIGAAKAASSVNRNVTLGPNSSLHLQ